MYGFIKACAATCDIEVADTKINADNIISTIEGLKSCDVSLVVFPELCLTGYTCGDLFNQQTLLLSAEKELSRICLSTVDTDMLIFLGIPVQFKGRLYNCAAAINNGELLGLVPKTFLPEYGEFYETRHFTSAFKGVDEISYAGFHVPIGTDIIFSDSLDSRFCVACEICEDLWSPMSPSVRHAVAGATLIVNLSCSDETIGKAEYRRDLVRMQSAKLICGYVYADSGDGESTTDMVFAGHNIICENGEILAESKLFNNDNIYAEIDIEKLSIERQRMSSSFFCDSIETGYKFVSFDSKKKIVNFERSYPQFPFVPENKDKLDERTSTILNIQRKGLEKRFKHTKSKSAIIGVSGGLDSALALLVTCRAFEMLNKDVKDIICVSMPGFGTSDGTRANSANLVEALGCTSKVVPIGDFVNSHFEAIGHEPSNKDTTYENCQARIRTLILMDLANEFDGLVIGTGDMSELALGWATYNGDHMSMYAVNSSVPKTLVKHLILFEAQSRGGPVCDVLLDILKQDISPELLPPDESGNITQKTEDIIGPYELHDFFLYYSVRFGFTPDKIQYIAERTFKNKYSDMEISKWLKNFYRRFFSQQYKRSCVPDGVKVGSVSLSPRADWRMPSDANGSIWIGLVK